MYSNLDVWGISGGMTDSAVTPVWQHFPEPFRKAYPGSRFSVVELPNCSPLDTQKWQNLINVLVQECNARKQKNNVRRPVILIGLSQGGAVACCVAALAKAGTVLGVVTIFTPHLMFSLQPWLLPMPYTIDVPIVSFYGTLDSQVWCGTEHVHSIAHEPLVSNHMGLGDNSKHAEKIAALARKYFSL